MNESSRQFFAVIALSIGAAVFYGLIHDQITARLCIEYFTVAHPPVIMTNSPTVQGAVWGVLATWWVGLILGIPLAIVARTGDFPAWSAARLVRPLAILLGAMAFFAVMAGLTGFILASKGVVRIGEGWADSIASEQHINFVAVAWAHNASYLSGFIGGIILIFYVWNARCGSALRLALR